MRLPFAYLLLSLLCTGCSQSSLLTKQDYQKSQQAFARGDTEAAQLDFPRRSEEGDFITTMEKAYLSLIRGTPQIKALQKQAEVLENQVRYHVSREARTFFYVQTPEDYYASEHEVIWMHFLLSWGYSQQGKFEDACVEARTASSLLSLPWSPAGHFDDATMRLMLASLWAMCGEWREAQVDLRAAWFLNNSLGWAHELAERDKPPSNLFVVLGGPGPEPVWNPEITANPLRTERQVTFKLRGRKSHLTIADQHGVMIEPHLSPDASRWYERHLARDNELHELLLDSTYGGKATLNGIKAGSKIAVTTGLGLAIGIGGSALGAAIIYYANGANAAELGLAVMAVSIKKGISISQEGYTESTTSLKQELDPSPTYRFVRYLPEYLWMGWSDQPLSYPLELRTADSRIMLRKLGIGKHIPVSVVYVPDTRTPCLYKIGNSATVESEIDTDGYCAPAANW
jgi:hypothetical protein